MPPGDLNTLHYLAPYMGKNKRSAGGGNPSLGEGAEASPLPGGCLTLSMRCPESATPRGVRQIGVP
jgi:hypothetical protein